MRPKTPMQPRGKILQGKGSKKKKKKKRRKNTEFVISKNSTEVDSTGNNKVYITVS